VERGCGGDDGWRKGHEWSWRELGLRGADLIDAEKKKELALVLR
jgi:hypothetical protein